MARFGLLGVAGYIAPRHLRAIKDTGNDLLVACDPHDSVGVLDGYFPEAEFHANEEDFWDAVERLELDWVVVCTPNYLHARHIKRALLLGANCICEKPLVLAAEDLDTLKEIEEETGKRVFTVLQLRLFESLHPYRLTEKGKAQVDLTYITRRGPWYAASWKGDEDKSGGLIHNIGIHFFDLLIWLFGAPQANRIVMSQPKKMAGQLELERASVRWFLSIDSNDLPKGPHPAFRSICIDGDEIELKNDHFVDLHTEIYKRTLAGEGFGLEDTRAALELEFTPDPPAKVDVLIPTHNRGTMLLECLRSVLSQSEQDFRIVIFDDGSTDGSTDLGVLPDDPRIVVMRTPTNRGIPYARNRLLDAVQAPYACWQDSDDVSHQKRLKTMLGLLEDTGADLALSHLYFFNGAVSRKHWHRYKVDTSQYQIPDEDGEPHDYGLPNNLTFATCFFRQAITEYKFNPIKIIAEDYDLFRRLLDDGKTFATHPEPLYFARRHPQRTTQLVAARRKRAQRRAGKK